MHLKWHRDAVPRRLQPPEIESLLAQAVPLRLATIDADGYPHVTALRFIVDGEAIVMTSYVDRSHISRARANPRVGVVIDVEGALRADGERPNQQIRVQGDAVVAPDVAYEWTSKIRRKYIDATTASGVADQVQRRPRTLVRVEPRSFVAVASI